MTCVGLFAVALMSLSASAEAQTLKSSVAAKGDPRGWYEGARQSELLARQGGGSATVSFLITAEGRVADCRTTSESGVPGVGADICRNLMRVARFVPGKAGAGTYSAKMDAY